MLMPLPPPAETSPDLLPFFRNWQKNCQPLEQHSLLKLKIAGGNELREHVLMNANAAEW
uniref:Uncharacterized protein n=1 Tax=Arundo donax TaxID=35708 RepID=A0A0A9HI55_ARUDO